MIHLPAGMQVFERGWLSSNNILFIGEQQAALVDSGYLTHAPQTLALHLPPKLLEQGGLGIEIGSVVGPQLIPRHFVHGYLDWIYW